MSQSKKHIVKASELCSVLGRTIIYWKTSQLHSEPWSLTVSFTAWPETFQSSWLLCNNNTSRVAAGTRYSTPSVQWMRSNHSPGMWPCSKAVRPSRHPYQPSEGAGGGQARLEGQLYFQGMTNWLCWLGESTYLPPALVPGTTRREDLLSIWGNATTQPATEEGRGLQPRVD